MRLKLLWLKVSRNPLKSGQCFSQLQTFLKMAAIPKRVAIPSNRVNVSHVEEDEDKVEDEDEEVAIPSNRVNVSHIRMVYYNSMTKGLSRNPLESGQCFSLPRICWNG